MRTLAICLTFGLVIGCASSSDDDATTTGETTTATTDEGTTDEGTTDEGTTDEGTTDEGTTDEGTTDEGTTDEGTTDEGTTTGDPVPDGLNGSPCTEAVECDNAEGYLCLFGFCSKVCRDDNGDVIEGACDEFSTSSEYGAKWGCPSDLRICIPGSVGGANMICHKDQECEAEANASYACSGPVPFGGGGKIMGGICIPEKERLGPGEACNTGSDCRTFICLGANQDTGEPGYCSEICKKNDDCVDGNLCMGLGFTIGEEATVDDYWAPMCFQFPGSLDYCLKPSKCDEGEICQTTIEPNSLKPQYHCVSANAEGAAAGEACTASSDCYSGFCLFGNAEEGGPEAYCSTTCHKEADSCGDNLSCSKVVLHQNGTADKSSDDILYDLCVKAQPGDDCSVLGSWCAVSGSECVPTEEGATLGTCSTPPAGCADEGGEACDDGLECTVDTCDETANQCDFSVLAADTCLIQGVCYAADESSPDNSCLVCNPSQGATAWSMAADDSTCDDGNGCTEADSCQAGSCVGSDKDCDDGSGCSTSSCVDDECKYEPLDNGTECNDDNACTENDACNAGLCAGSDISCADTECTTAGACDPINGCQFTDKSNDTDCDDGNGCTEGDKCTDGSCTAGTNKDCSDNNDCTDDNCNPVDGKCDNPNKLADSECSDDNACTENDTCNGTGSCTSGTPKDCSAQDGNCKVGVCSDGSCSAENAVENAACEDGKECTLNDVCNASGGCESSGQAQSCDDGIACTDDACIEGSGCVNTPTAACTTYADVTPIVSAKCAPCHTVGSSSGLSVTTYSTTQINAGNFNCTGKTHGECMIIRIKNGSMPQNKGCTGDPTTDVGNNACLTQEQQDVIQSWVDDGQLQ